jgi:deoxyhypusine synthase
MKRDKSRYVSEKQIIPIQIPKKIDVGTLIGHYFQASNAPRFPQSGQLFVEKRLKHDVAMGVSLSGVLTSGGLGASFVPSLIRTGFANC